MPNYCHNTLSFHGDVNIISELRSHIITSKNILTFEKVLPTPDELTDNNKSEEELKKLEKKYGYNNWYDWRIHNWGTKWDATNSHVILEDENNIKIFFDTAWCPPMTWLFYVIKLYPKLDVTIRFIDSLGGLIGIYQLENEKVILDGYFNDYNCYEENGDFDEVISKRLVEQYRRNKITKIVNNIKST